MAEIPSAHSLWRQAHDEHPDDGDAGARRYHDLMVEHGLIVCKTCGLRRDDPDALSCSSAFHRTEQSGSKGPSQFGRTGQSS